MGAGVEPVRAFEPSAREVAGVGENPAAKDPRGDVVDSRGQRGGRKGRAVATVSFGCGTAGMRLETGKVGGCGGDDGLQHGIDCRQGV